MREFGSISEAIDALRNKQIFGFKVVRDDRVSVNVRRWEENAMQLKMVRHGGVEDSGIYANLVPCKELDVLLVVLLGYVERGKNRNQKVVIREIEKPVSE